MNAGARILVHDDGGTLELGAESAGARRELGAVAWSVLELIALTSVDVDGLRAVLSGLDPHTRARLGQRRKDRVPGFDLTFSAPKSVLWDSANPTRRPRSAPRTTPRSPAYSAGRNAKAADHAVASTATRPSRCPEQESNLHAPRGAGGFKPPASTVPPSGPGVRGGYAARAS